MSVSTYVSAWVSYICICTIDRIWLCVKRTSNVHKDRTKESRKTKNTYDFLVLVRTFLLPLSLKVLRHKERDTHSFYSGFVIPPPRLVRHLPKASESKQKSTLIVRCPVLNSTNFLQNSQNPPHASGAWRHSHLLALFPIWAIVIALSDTSASRMRALTPALMLHLSNPCTEPN